MLLFTQGEFETRCMADRYLRNIFYYNQNKLCIYCEIEMCNKIPVKHPAKNYITFDHLVPKPKGGARFPIKNLIGACCKCNNKKHETDFQTYFKCRKENIKGEGRTPVFTLDSIKEIQSRVYDQYKEACILNKWTQKLCLRRLSHSDREEIKELFNGPRLIFVDAKRSSITQPGEISSPVSPRGELFRQELEQLHQ